MPFTEQDKKDVMEYGEQQYERGQNDGAYHGYANGYSDGYEEGDHEGYGKGYRQGLLHGILLGSIGWFAGLFWYAKSSRRT